MPITVTVEDGTGLANANSYVSVAEADAFHVSNFHTATAWAALTADQKAAAVITATRILDQQWIWNGGKASTTQALQWPRVLAPDPDFQTAAVYPYNQTLSLSQYLPSNAVPPAIKRATCDFASAIAAKNFEKAPQGEGISSFSLDGMMSVSFDLATRPDFVPEWIQSELSKYGSMTSSKAGMVKLVRA